MTHEQAASPGRGAGWCGDQAASQDIVLRAGLEVPPEGWGDLPSYSGQGGQSVSACGDLKPQQVPGTQCQLEG